MSIRIILADDHAMLREGLKSLLADEPEVEVIGEAGSGLEAVRMACELAPDVVVMDVSMPDLHGSEATRRILAEAKNTKVVVLSLHSDKAVVAHMLQAGAMGYVPKTCSVRELVTAIVKVAGGGTYLSPEIEGVVVHGLLGIVKGEEVRACTDLTSREREVLRFISEGLTSKEIASILDISAKTVQTHRQHVMDKLDLHEVASLTKYAVRTGMTSPGK